jgi:hypothetical protein
MGTGKFWGPSHKWEDNIRIEATGCETVNWTQLAQDKGEWWDLVNTANEPLVFHVSWGIF